MLSRSDIRVDEAHGIAHLASQHIKRAIMLRLVAADHRLDLPEPIIHEKVLVKVHAVVRVASAGVGEVDPLQQVVGVQVVVLAVGRDVGIEAVDVLGPAGCGFLWAYLRKY